MSGCHCICGNISDGAHVPHRSGVFSGQAGEIKSATSVEFISILAMGALVIALNVISIMVFVSCRLNLPIILKIQFKNANSSSEANLACTQTGRAAQTNLSSSKVSQILHI